MKAQRKYEHHLLKKPKKPIKDKPRIAEPKEYILKQDRIELCDEDNFKALLQILRENYPDLNALDGSEVKFQVFADYDCCFYESDLPSAKAFAVINSTKQVLNPNYDKQLKEYKEDQKRIYDSENKYIQKLQNYKIALSKWKEEEERLKLAAAKEEQLELNEKIQELERKKNVLTQKQLN